MKAPLRKIRRAARKAGRNDIATLSDAELGRKWSLHVIRCEAKFWGHDLSDMSDDELEAGVLRFADMVGKAGVTAKEAADALYVMAKA